MKKILWHQNALFQLFVSFSSLGKCHFNIIKSNFFEEKKISSDIKIAFTYYVERICANQHLIYLFYLGQILCLQCLNWLNNNNIHVHCNTQVIFIFYIIRMLTLALHRTTLKTSVQCSESMVKKTNMSCNFHLRIFFYCKIVNYVLQLQLNRLCVMYKSWFAKHVGKSEVQKSYFR